ncbi:general stress protein [Methylacidiphilum kamchatkense Kam1]|uniref:Aryl-alcohol dehydrogenase-like predicted oxidoreductase n=1 Tax=Methylacidiphilum kamchatkense Kam1 TaxID=1202785 RepID=A0A0C1URY0_9BACT|nr:aldo/keto reductase [Methylacidiphilum kamchatkense]KIE59074.1 general stress protein [Methylacidiphilum kamchatkense Kam1]QDQ43016.1 aryl-alcohol dehydrogenase-like predicted oxidoreductase [Methylacidiphilum kamchatkense Kam1]
MDYIQIPAIAEKVSRIALGTWVMGGWMWGGIDEKEAIQAIIKAVEGGINIIDTAPIYGFGKAEEIVGKALRLLGKSKPIVIATKFGLEWNQRGEIRRNSSPTRIKQEIEDSLRRLGLSVIDIYQVHWPDSKVPFEQTAECLWKLKEQGKIRAIGVSNFSPRQMELFKKAAPIHTNQPPYNLFEREIEKELLPYCIKERIATLTYGVLCRGLLTGKFRPESTFPDGDLRKIDPKFQGENFLRYLQAVEKFRPIATRYGKSLAQFAACWALMQPGVSVVLWGARRPSQIEEAFGATGWSLTQEDLRLIDKILTETIPQPIGPEFMAPIEG